MKLRKVDHAVIFVTDMKRALNFYSKTLGAKVGYTSSGWSELETEGIRVALHDSRITPEDRRKGQSIKISFQVLDIKKAVLELKRKGVTITREPGEIVKGTWLAEFLDSEGNAINLTQYSRKHQSRRRFKRNL